MARDATLEQDPPLRLRRAPVAAPAPALAASWTETARAVLPAFLVTRLLVLVAGALAVAIWGIVPVDDVYDPQGRTTALGEPLSTIIAPLARWDSAWLLDVADVRYPAGYEPRTAFFPLYPLLVRVLGFALTPLVAGLVLSAVAAFGGAMLVHRIAERELGRRVADRAVWALLLFPGSLWLSAVYTEGLFLLLAAGCILAAHQGRWLLAGMLGALASATRSAGIVLAAVLVVVWWEQRRAALHERRPLPDAPAAALAAGMVPLGLVAFLVGLALAGHPWTAPFDVQAEWQRQTTAPWVGAWDGLVAGWHGAGQVLGLERAPAEGMLGLARLNVALLLCLVGALLCLAGTARRLRPSLTAYAGLALLLPLCSPASADGGTQPLMSLPRFVGVLFPLAIWLAWWLDRRGAGWRWTLALAGGGLLALVSALTARWTFVA
jgi:hypothetical protein